jgi:hypothetical protein
LTFSTISFSTISFHLRRSSTCSVHFISFVFFKSFLTSSSHLDSGFPTGLFVNGFHLYVLCWNFFSVSIFKRRGTVHHDILL